MFCPRLLKHYHHGSRQHDVTISSTTHLRRHFSLSMRPRRHDLSFLLLKRSQSTITTPGMSEYNGSRLVSLHSITQSSHCTGSASPPLHQVKSPRPSRAVFSWGRSRLMDVVRTLTRARQPSVVGWHYFTAPRAAVGPRHSLFISPVSSRLAHIVSPDVTFLLLYL